MTVSRRSSSDRESPEWR